MKDFAIQMLLDAFRGAAWDGGPAALCSGGRSSARPADHPRLDRLLPQQPHQHLHLQVDIPFWCLPLSLSNGFCADFVLPFVNEL